MNVEVGDALAHPVVDGDECPVRFHGELDARAEQLGVAPEVAEQIPGKIAESLEVGARYQKAVAREQWTVIEECDGVIVLEDHMRGNFVGGDAAEGTHCDSVRPRIGRGIP